MNDYKYDFQSNSAEFHASFMPTVIENTVKGERVFDIPSRLFQDRIIMLCTEINRQVATSIVSQFLTLYYANAEKPIRLMINSPGGEVVAGFAIYDIMQWVKCDVETWCIGEACSAASLILAGGTKGKRVILPTSRVLLHKPRGGLQGHVNEVEVGAKEMLRMNQIMLDILHKHTGRSRDLIDSELNRDFILDAQAAVEYGIVDKVLESK